MEKDGFQFGIGKEGTGFSIFLADRTKVCVCVRLCVCVGLAGGPVRWQLEAGAAGALL